MTGAGGFIGSHVCERLVADGADVIGLCRYTSRRDIGNLAELDDDVLDALRIEFGDLADADFIATLVRESRIVIHLGASISVPYSYVAPREVITTNIEGTLSILTAARALDSPPRVIQLSSSEVYGTAQTVPISEDHPLHAQSPYAASKVGADKIAETFHLSYALPVVIARPFNTYGPRQSERAVIGTIVRQALAGSELRLGDTSTRRDFVHVLDTVDALVALAAADAKHDGGTFNVATGEDASIQEVVETVAELVGRELTVVSEEHRHRPPASEVRRLVGDPSRLREATGWEPRTSLREGLASVIEWASTSRRAESSGGYAI